MKFNKNEIMAKATRFINKSKFKLKKNSPEILVIMGIVGAVGAAVMACKATTEAEDVIEEAKTDIDCIENGNEETTAIVESDRKKVLAKTYVKYAGKIAVIYIPSVVVGGLSIVSILASHGMIRKRNAALAAYAAAVVQDFKKYRANVVEEYGTEVDTKLRHGLQTIKVDEVTIDPETGKKKKSKKNVDIIDPDKANDYTYIFDSRSREYQNVYDYNIMYLHAQEQYFTNILGEHGYLFLNDVLHELDLPEDKRGQVVGWIYNPEGTTNDNAVDFRICETNERDDDGNLSPVIMLDFNVDGYILDDAKF